MLGRLISGGRRAVDGFLLVPGLVALAHIALAIGLVRADRALGRDAVGFLFDGDASAARGVLETIAGSLITVAGLAFSLTIVVLALVSSQFSPRAVPGFLADRVNQVIAGAFVGVFAYTAGRPCGPGDDAPPAQVGSAGRRRNSKEVPATI